MAPRFRLWSWCSVDVFRELYESPPGGTGEHHRDGSPAKGNEARVPGDHSDY
jgi:hypothetical protein